MFSETIKSDLVHQLNLKVNNNNNNTEESQRKRQESNLSSQFRKENARRLSLLSETPHNSSQQIFKGVVFEQHYGFITRRQRKSERYIYTTGRGTYWVWRTPLLVLKIIADHNVYGTSKVFGRLCT